MGGGFEAASTTVSVIRAQVTRIDEPPTPASLAVAFDPVPFSGMLVAGTDGLFKYCVPKAMADILSAIDGERIVGRLVAAVRLPSGALRDDVGIVVISP